MFLFLEYLFPFLLVPLKELIKNLKTLKGTSCLFTGLFLYGRYLFINIFSGVHAQFCNRG
jgi:hypothetical protein